MPDFGAPAPVPSVQTLSHWVDLGHALRVRPWIDPLIRESDVSARLLGARVLWQLGDERASLAIQLRVFREHPSHEGAQLAGLRAVLSRGGAHAFWVAIQRCPRNESASAATRAERLSLEGYWLSLLRDYPRALQYQRDALALQPDSPWLWVEHSYTLAQLDRVDAALEAAHHALSLQPEYRTALLQAARLLQRQQRRDKARALLEPALDATENAAYAWQLYCLARDEQRHEDELTLLDRTELALPRADKYWTSQIAASRADAWLLLGQVGKACSQAEKVSGSGFYGQLAQRLVDLNDSEARPQRVLLQLAMVQQHWMTCAPATLSALANYWGRTADHLEIAQAICYDGTPQASEREWAVSQGFWVRECKLDWNTACALIDSGVPFALATRHVGGGHLQAVVGVDRLRRTLLVRDPSEFLHAEYEAENLFDAQQAGGPRAMVMLPAGEEWRVAGITLPEADAWDLVHGVLAALQRHDRPAAIATLNRLQDLEPGSDNALRAERTVAIYDGDETRVLASTEALLKRYPLDRTLQLSRLNSLIEVRGQDEAHAYLAELVAQPRPDTLLLARWASRLAQDGRRLLQTLSVLRRALRMDGACAQAWSELASTLWAAQGAASALEPARWASTLQPTAEWAAADYARACRVAGEPQLGLMWLRERNDVWGDRSGLPAVTLAEELETQQLDADADAVLNQALARRPTDTPLRLFLAERALRAQNLDEADKLLESCTEAHAPELLRVRALLQEERGELDLALRSIQEAVCLAPLQLKHHRLLLRLLRRKYGDSEALARWRPLADAHPAHLGLQRLLYDTLPDEPQAIAAQLDHMHAYHADLAWLQRERAIQASRQERHNDAVSLARAAVSLAPGSAASHDTLAYCLLRRDGYAAAVPHMHAALERDVEYEPAVLRLLNAPTPDLRREGVDFLSLQLRQQALLGDGLLSFQSEAASIWPADAVLELLRGLRASWPALWQGAVAEALQLMRLQRQDEAQAVLIEARERFPALPRIHLELADALRIQGRIDEALAANARTLELSPGWNRAVRLQVDMLCLHHRRWEDAGLLLQRTTRSTHGWNDADLIGLLAWVHEKQGSDGEALIHARRSLQIDPKAKWVWSIIRRISERAESPTQFDAVVEAIVNSRPGDASAWLVQAEHARDDALALTSAERAIALQPRNEAAWQARFERLRRLGRMDEIDTLLMQLPWPHPAPAALRAWGARAAWARGNRTVAIQGLRQLSEEAAPDEGLCVLLADWLDEVDDHAGYLAQARILVQLAPHEARSHAYLGHALNKSERSHDALEPLQHALELSPDYAFAARQLAVAARGAGLPDMAEPALQALWPHLQDVATACDGIELAISAQHKERALNWLERLFTLEQFEIDRCKSALDAWRAAGWGETLQARQREHVARGGGPVGVALDWLQQTMKRSSFLLTYARALHLLRRTEKPHLMLALMRWLTTADAHRLLKIALRLHGPRLRVHSGVWGEASYVLSHFNDHRAVVRWLHDWRNRDRPPHYAMANLAGSLAVLRRWGELAEVVDATLLRFPNQEDMRLWRLLLRARAGDLDSLDAELARCHEWQPDAWMEPLLEAIRAFLDLAKARAGAGTVAAFRRRLLHSGPDQAQVLYRELWWLAAWRHTPWTHWVAWLTPTL